MENGNGSTRRRTASATSGTTQDWAKLRAEVGRTPFQAAPLLGRQLKIPNLFVKDEGANPTGSHKDRIARAHIERALATGATTVAVVAGSGYAGALARFAHAAGLSAVVYMPKEDAPRRTGEMESHGARVVPFDGDFADCVKACTSDAKREGWLDANPGPATMDVTVAAYAPLSEEIFTSLGKVPDVVAVPTSHGSTVTGLWAGFEALKAKGTIRVPPKILAASTKRGNPIIWSLAKGDDVCEDLDEHEVWASEASAPLQTYHALDGNAALASVRSSAGWGYAAGDEELQNLAKQVQRATGLEVSPASTAGVAALHFAAKFRPLEADQTHVAILTSRP